jgi:flavin reductase (DIM6/NTAB) family NADH-FMN oxidoreductase RutF
MVSNASALNEPLASLFPRAMSRVCTPVAVVTTFDGNPHGTTVSAFASLSVNPPMILVSLDRESELLRRLTDRRAFGLNVLSSLQSELATRFAREGPDTFAGLAWHQESGYPRFEGAAVWLGCSVTDLIDGGDHRVVLAEVLRVEVSDAEPLTYHARAFGTHAPVPSVSSSFAARTDALTSRGAQG